MAGWFSEGTPTTAATPDDGRASQAQNRDLMPSHSERVTATSARLASPPSTFSCPDFVTCTASTLEKAAPNPGNCSGTKPGPVEILNPVPAGACRWTWKP